MMLRRLRRAQDLLARGAPRQALSMYRKVLASRPNDGGAQIWSGVALCELGRFEQAQPFLEQASSRIRRATPPSWSGARCRRGPARRSS